MIHWTPEELADMARYDAEVDAMPCDQCKKWRAKQKAARDGNHKAASEKYL